MNWIAMIIPRDYFKQILSIQKQNFCLIPSAPRPKKHCKIEGFVTCFS